MRRSMLVLTIGFVFLFCFTLGVFDSCLARVPEGTSPVYRFYNTQTGSHFFTISEAEKNTIINTYPQFTYEGVAWYSYTSPSVPPDAKPVYRFFNTRTGTHFFTIDENEKNYIIAAYAEYNYEGIAWYAFAAYDLYKSYVPAGYPVYRFYNTSTGTHFFTIDEDEKDAIIINYPWFTYEGIAWYSFQEFTYTNSLGQTFVLIPAGTFTMGSPAEEQGRRSYYEGPQHTVTLTQSYYMQNTEVTQEQWETVMGGNPSSFYWCSTSCPVESVTWNDVQDFIDKMNQRGEGTYRLPTEAEWEYAARAGSTTAFYNGGITSYSEMNDCNYDANLNAIGWYCYNSGGVTHPVAKKAPNAWGLYDMSGNVCEWCQDWFDSKYYERGPSTDPKGPPSGSSRVIRGGGWSHCARSCRSADRDCFKPERPNCNIGFRLVFSPGE